MENSPQSDSDPGRAIRLQHAETRLATTLIHMGLGQAVDRFSKCAEGHPLPGRSGSSDGLEFPGQERLGAAFRFRMVSGNERKDEHSRRLWSLLRYPQG